MALHTALRLIGQGSVSVRALASDWNLRRGARHGVGVEEDMRVEALAAEWGEDEFEEVGLDGGLRVEGAVEAVADRNERAEDALT